MRNLKRALSLALAAMMLIGMMVVSAGAASKDFTDKGEITHSEAVNTLVALNVISGKGDGSYFDPTGTLTRAEMAKLITYVLNGGVEPVLGTKVTPTYSDIDGHWAEAYIEYCTSMNIIVGDGTGKFNPEGTLTASQCAKMLLTAMNYKDDVFGFLGSSWEINVNREANAAGLYKELGSIAASSSISRDDAAQMVYNAIQADTMKLSWDQNMTTGQITQQYNPDGPSLFEDKFEGLVWIGTFVGDSNTDSTITDGEIRVNGKLDSSNGDDSNADFPYDLDLSNIGEQVKVLFKDGTGGQKDAPDKKDTIYGVYNTGSTQVVNATLGSMKDQKSADAKINVGGTKYNTADTVDVVYNYDVAKTVAGVSAKGATDTNSDLTDRLKKANGDTVKFVFNSDGKITTAYVTNSVLTYVTAVNNEKVSISGIGSLTVADHDIYSGIAKNDIVVVTTLYTPGDADGDDAYNIVKKAEVVSGTVTGYKNQESVTLDGTVYKIYNGADMKTSMAGETGIKAFNEAGQDYIGETFDLYLVNGYVAFAVQTSESASNYSLVTASNKKDLGDKWDPLKIEVLAADGTKTTLTPDEDSDEVDVGDIITYTGSASEALVKVATYASTTTSTAAFYNKTSKTVEGTVTTSDAVLFVDTDGSGEYKAYSIRGLGNIDETGRACKIVEKDDKVVAAYIALGDTPAGATSTAIYGMVTADNGTIKIGDDNYYTYTMWTTEGEKTVNVKVSDAAVKLNAGTIYKYEPTADNCYTNTASKVAFATGFGTTIAVKNYDEAEGLLTYYTTKDTTPPPDAKWSGETTKAVDEDLVVLYVDVDAKTAGAEIGINSYDDITDLYNAIIVLDDDVITHIIVETSNKKDIA